MFGLLGWMVWTFPNPPPQPGGQRQQGEGQFGSLAQDTPLPLLQPEEETSTKDASARLASRRRPPSPAPPPAAKKRQPDPPPADEKRPPDLPQPEPPAKAPSKKEPPPPGMNRGEAESLGEELVKAAPEQQDALLEKLCKGKGQEYTRALAAAIARLSGESKQKARQTLADRLTRFTARTLLAYLGSENPELRRAAALALAMKDDKDHISELIDLLEDPEPFVVRAAHSALKSLTSEDSAPEPKAAAEERAAAPPARPPEPRGRASPSRQPMPPGEEKPPAEDSLASKAKKQKKEDDLPDPGLVPPPPTPPSVEALLRGNMLALQSKKPSERVQAARVLGGLGEEGKPARRLLCRAMLDPVIAVRVAAADALKNIDPRTHHQAVELKVAIDNNDAVRVATLLEMIQKLEDDGEPLAPLVAHVAKLSASTGTNALLTSALTTLSRIGRKDLSSFLVIAAALTHRDPLVRAVALHGLVGMKHGRLAAPRILVLLKIDISANRIAAIEALTALADEGTEEIIYKAIHDQRYHPDAEVRQAVELAKIKLENKQNPQPEDNHAKQACSRAFLSSPGGRSLGRRASAEDGRPAHGVPRHRCRVHGQPRRGRETGRQAAEARPGSARIRSLREPGLHLKQRRGAPCERPGRPQGGRAYQQALRRVLPAGGQLQDRRQAEAGGQRGDLLLCPGRPRPQRHRRPGGRQDAARRGRMDDPEDAGGDQGE
jgi:HEAT repeat protein